MLLKHKKISNFAQMLKIFLIIFCSLIIVIFFATKINHVKTWKEKNYEKLILEFGEPKILSELKGRHIVKTDLNQIKTSVLEHYRG